MLTEKRINEIFNESQVLQAGHFLLTSGRHSEQYMQVAKVLQYPHLTEELCKELADGFREFQIDLVVAPAMGGIIIGYEVAKHLGTKSIFAERENGKMTFRRGFTINPGDKVLVTEDVVTTGGSVFETIDAVREAGGVVIGVGVFVDRSGGKIKFGVETKALLSMDIKSYLPEECPLCKQGIPFIKPGSRKI